MQLLDEVRGQPFTFANGSSPVPAPNSMIAEVRKACSLLQIDALLLLILHILYFGDLCLVDLPGDLLAAKLQPRPFARESSINSPRDNSRPPRDTTIRRLLNSGETREQKAAGRKKPRISLEGWSAFCTPETPCSRSVLVLLKISLFTCTRGVHLQLPL